MPEKALIGMRVLQKRLKDEKKQLEFATELSVCEKTIRNLEQSNANPILKTLKRIAANMQKSVSSFCRDSHAILVAPGISALLRRNTTEFFRAFRRLP